MFQASNILYIVVLGLAKCAASLSIIGLTVPERGSIHITSLRNKAYYAASTVCAVIWTIGTIVTLGLYCIKADPMSLSSSGCNGSVCVTSSSNITCAILLNLSSSYAPGRASLQRTA